MFPMSDPLQNLLNIPKTIPNGGIDKILYSKMNAILSFANENVNNSGIPYAKKRHENTMLELLSNSRVDELLMGTDELDEVENAYIKSLKDPVRDFIISLIWRHLPIPLNSLPMLNDKKPLRISHVHFY